MSSEKTTSGISIVGILTVVFIVMKLAYVGDVAHWSWFFVIFTPLLGAIGIFLAFVVVYFLGKIVFGITALAIKHFRVKAILGRIDKGKDVSQMDRLTAWWYVQKNVEKRADAKEIKAKILAEKANPFENWGGDRPERPKKTAWQERMEQLQQDVYRNRNRGWHDEEK